MTEPADVGRRVPGSSAPTAAVPAAEATWSPSALDHGRFIPGTMLAGRYRIVGLLGRGGMGEVYRADDLKLGQAVALKFLPAHAARDRQWLARFHQEVRMARQVSHPNVCRVYDIGEVDGHHFLSMEYIDGEDLASLLRRIGRLPPDKALELARHLCAGLAAAHDRGVLHRDLKPANVLVDGRGRARLADFGLAGLSERGDGRDDPGAAGGTPAYMAPEQFTGAAASVRTDLYALGLVLLEMFTGKALSKTLPATLDLDPAIERVILRCLDKDPERRPQSALAVAAALPGGDPLAAALAAGETPAPDVVAAAGEAGSLSPRSALACFVAVALCLVPVAWLSRQTTLPGLVTMEKGPEVLAERARTIARSFGYAERGEDEAYGYETNADYLRYVDKTDRSPTRWRVLKANRPPAIRFWFRQSPQSLWADTTLRGFNRVTRDSPPDSVPGMVSVTLDPAGRLVGFTAVPPRTPDTSGAVRPMDWKRLLAEADWPVDRLSTVNPQWTPPVYADAQMAWEGTIADRPELPMRLEAAALNGRPVWFDIIGPWTEGQSTANAPAGRGARLVSLLSRLTVTAALVAAVFMARRNLRLGRGDSRGAFRLALFFLVMSVTDDTIMRAGDIDFRRALPLACLRGLLVWVLYVALEPHVRRIWPETLIGWSRLLAGRVRDPRVGGDILIGVLAGLVASAAMQFIPWASTTWLALPPPAPGAASSDLLLGGRHGLSQLAATLGDSATTDMVFLFVLAVVSVLVRDRRIAAGGLMVVATIVASQTIVSPVPGYPMLGLLQAAVTVGTMFVLVRFGLLAVIATVFVRRLTSVMPIAFDPTLPYVASSYLLVGTIVILAAYGLHAAIGGRPIFAAEQ